MADVLDRLLERLGAKRYHGKTWELERLGIRVYMVDHPRLRGNPFPVIGSNVMLIHPETPLTRRQAVHEYTHYLQMRREGPLFVPKMAVQNLLAFFGREQEFEREARDAEQSVPEPPMPGSPAARRAAFEEQREEERRSFQGGSGATQAVLKSTENPFRQVSEDVFRFWQEAGFTRKQVEARYQALRQSFEGWRGTFEEWYNRQPLVDRMFAVLTVGHPFVRDTVIAYKQTLQESAEYREYFSRPDVVARLHTASPNEEDQQMSARFWATVQERLASGKATAEYAATPFWQKVLYDMTTWAFAPSVFGAGMRLGGKYVVAPFVRGAGWVLSRVAPGVYRQFLRTGAAIADLNIRQIVARLDTMLEQGQLTKGMHRALVRAAEGFRQDWTKRFEDAIQAEGEGRTFVLDLMRRVGHLDRMGNVTEAGQQALHIVQVGSNRTEWALRQFEARKQAILSKMEEARKALAALAPNDPSRPAVEARLASLNRDLALEARSAVQAIRAITPESVAKDLGYTVTPDMKKTITTLVQEIRNKMKTLPPTKGAPAIEPYFPSFGAATPGQAVRGVPHVIEPFEIPRSAPPSVGTAKEAMESLANRVALAAWRGTEEAREKAYLEFVDSVVKELASDVQAGIKDDLLQIAIPGDKAARTITGVIMQVWKDIVLIGRPGAWLATNLLGNSGRLVTQILTNWAKGRWVNPLDMFKKMEIPVYMAEGQMASISRGFAAPETWFGRLRAFLYGLNSHVEIMTRSASIKLELRPALAELAKRGVRGETAYDLALKMGWEQSRKYMYDYANRWWATRVAGDLAPFLQFNIENIRFWYQQLQETPWLLSVLVNIAEERPEIKVALGRLLPFLDRIGIDSRVIGLTEKMDFVRMLEVFANYEPPFITEKKRALAEDYQKLLVLAEQRPEAERQAWIDAQLEARPDLKVFVDWLQQGIAVRIMQKGLDAIGVGGPAEWVLSQLGIDLRPFSRRTGVVPQELMLRDLAGRLARQLGVPEEQLQGWIIPPTDDEIHREVRRLQIEAQAAGRSLNIADPKVLETVRQQAITNIMARRTADQVLDMMTWGGSWVLKHADELQSRLKDDESLPPEISARVRAAPTQQQVWETGVRYGLWTFPGLSREDAGALATYIAKRRLEREVDLRTPEARRAQVRAVEALPDELQQLKQTTDPVVRRAIDLAMSAAVALDRMDTTQERREYLANTLEGRVYRAFLDTRWTPDERALADEVLSLGRADRFRWYQNALQQHPERAQLFRELFPRDAAAFDSRLGRSTPTAPLLQPPPPNGVEVPTRSQRPEGAPPGPPMPARPDPTYHRNPTTLSPEGRKMLMNAEGVRLQAYRDPGDEARWIEANKKRRERGEPEQPYQGRWAIGYGTTGPEGRVVRLPDGTSITLGPNARLSARQAEALFDREVAAREAIVRKNLTRPDGTQVPVTQSMFDALVSYVYNSGDEPNAPIWRALRAGDYDEAARILRNPRTPGENRTAGVPEDVRQGLQARRNREADLFDKDGRPDRRAVVGPPPVPTPPSGSDKPRMSDVPTPQRDGFRYVDDRGKIIYNASITDALIDYARRINPSLTPAEARRIAGAVMAVYQDPTKQPDEWYGFDPLAIMGIIAARSRFTPGYRDPSQDRHGLMGLRPSDAPGLSVQDLYDPVKNVRAGIEAFRSVEARLGTRGALEYFGISWSDWIAYSGRVLGLYPVTYNPRVPLERGVRTPNLPIGGAAAAGTPEERAVAEVMTRLAQAGGNPDDPGYLARRRQEWAQIIERASPDVLRRMQIVAPDLWREIEQIRRGGPTWYRGQAVIEDVGLGPDAQAYAAWKRQVLMAETREEALKTYLAGTPAQRERFAIYNREMARFFGDAQEGVWWSPQWEFSARAGDEKYLAARHKLARAVATGDRGIVRQVTREIRSMFGDDVPGFLRTLRQDTPGVFEIVAPYLQGQEYTAEMKLRVREFRLQIEDWIKKAQSDPEALGQAAAAWRDPANAGLVDLIEEHEPEWYAKTQRLLRDEPPIGHYVPITQTMEFERWRMRLAEAYRSRDMEALQKVWSDPEVPETFRQELKTHELRDYLRYAPMLNGVEPAEWVAHREREAYSPYLSYLSMNDLYGPWSPQKLKQILEENPAAVEWILRDPENRLRYRSALESRVVGLYAGTLKAYNYHPALLNAIPDDGTRHWLALMDPAAAEAFARYGVRVTPTERPLIPAVRSAAEVYGTGSVVEPIRPTDGGPVRKYRVRTPNMEDREIDTQQLITDLGLAVETPAMSRAFAAQAQQWTQAKGIVQALQFVGQGIEIGIRGGGFMEQLPSYFSAFQAAAGAGLFGPAAAAFATGPAGIIIGGVLGILGGIFGASRQAAEQARQRAIAIARARFQAAGQAFDLRERLRSLSKQELTTLDARTGAVTAFLEKPSAITRQGLVDALKLPTPSW